MFIKICDIIAFMLFVFAVSVVIGIISTAINFVVKFITRIF